MVSRYTYLLIVHQAAVMRLNKAELALAFVKVLAAFNSVYHFDEDAHDIMEAHTGATLFSYEEAELCNYIRDYCYSNYLFELAVKACHGEVV